MTTIYIRDDGQCHMAPINLEGCTDSGLAKIAAHPAVHADVRRMASLYIESRKARLAGDISQAQRLEDKAERLYETLPTNLRW